MKHTFVLFLSLILLVLPGCSAEKSSADTAKKTLTIYSTMSTDSERDTFRKLAAHSKRNTVTFMSAFISQAMTMKI